MMLMLYAATLDYGYFHATIRFITLITLPLILCFHSRCRLSDAPRWRFDVIAAAIYHAFECATRYALRRYTSAAAR